MKKIGFTGVNLQNYNSKSEYFLVEGAYLDSIWGRGWILTGCILTHNSIKNLKIWVFTTFFRDTLLSWLRFGQFSGTKTCSKAFFLVSICSKAYFVNFYIVLMSFLQKNWKSEMFLTFPLYNGALVTIFLGNFLSLMPFLVKMLKIRFFRLCFFDLKSVLFVAIFCRMSFLSFLGYHHFWSKIRF